MTHLYEPALFTKTLACSSFSHIGFLHLCTGFWEWGRSDVLSWTLTVEKADLCVLTLRISTYSQWLFGEGKRVGMCLWAHIFSWKPWILASRHGFLHLALAFLFEEGRWMNIFKGPTLSSSKPDLYFVFCLRLSSSHIFTLTWVFVFPVRSTSVWCLMACCYSSVPFLTARRPDQLHGLRWEPHFGRCYGRSAGDLVQRRGAHRSGLDTTRNGWPKKNSGFGIIFAG